MKNNGTDTRYILGFSLVELSIVLIIIGLLVGGVISGSKLIQQSKLRALVAEIQDVKTAISTFTLTYDGLPGDIEDATSFWTSCTDVVGNTCNGNGDGIVDDVTGEDYRAWQHLSLAEIYPGNFTGLAVGFVIGVNVPTSVIKGGTYRFDDRIGLIYGRNGKLMRFGSVGGGVSDVILTATDSRKIDKKLDDGVPNTGGIYVIRGNSVASTAGRCVDQATSVPSTTAVNFVLTDKEVSCALYFWSLY